jgi:hypothetical protein
MQRKMSGLSSEQYGDHYQAASPHHCHKYQYSNSKSNKLRSQILGESTFLELVWQQIPAPAARKFFLLGQVQSPYRRDYKRMDLRSREADQSSRRSGVYLLPLPHQTQPSLLLEILEEEVELLTVLEGAPKLIEEEEAVEGYLLLHLLQL